MSELARVLAAYRTDCRHFRGEKPCGFQEACDPCESYAPMGTRILVVKLAAIGDVLRTTPILVPLRARHDPCHVTWLTDRGAAELLATTPGIDRLLAYGIEAVVELMASRFDLLICLDKEPRATGLAMAIAASTKLGFGMTPEGTLTILNPEAEYAYRLGLSDTLKFKENAKPYPRDRPRGVRASGRTPSALPAPARDGEIAAARERLAALGLREGERAIGLNTGCGPVFATKKWTEEGYVELAARLAGPGALAPACAVLLGGPDERERNPRIRGRAAALGARVLDTGCDNGLREFAALVGQLSLLVTGDTLALHLGVGLGVPTLAIMGSTSATEIHLYDRGRKVVTDFPCSPCYLKTCPLPVTCMDAMPAERVSEAAREILSTLAAVRRS
ncbi:MAG: glycosyltransferase family 9 protein [Acidobacteriota bacterium]